MRRHPPVTPHAHPLKKAGLWLALVAGVGSLGPVYAVDEIGKFQLDANAMKSLGSNTTPDDWDNVFGITSAPQTPTAGDGESFILDRPSLVGGSDIEDRFDGNNKDVMNVSAWKHQVGAVTPSKDNITNAYAKSYRWDHDGDATTPEHMVIYFGADRFSNVGDAALGFWFFKDDVAPVSGGTFSGAHTDQDVLVQVDFTGGPRQLFTIQVFRFQSDGKGDTGKYLKKISSGTSSSNLVCDGPAGDHDACALVNLTGTTAPWPYSSKETGDTNFPRETFFEGGIDITELFGEDVCFSSFMAETRTSHSETAALKDFAAGNFDTCGSIDLTQKKCETIAGVSPKYTPDPADPLKSLYQTIHTLTISNPGVGPVYNVGIRDEAVNADDLCDITKIDGVAVNPSVAVTDPAAFYPVKSSLAGGGTMTVTLQCVTNDNPFANTATVRAEQKAGSGTYLTDSYAEESPAGNENRDGLVGCSVSLSPSIAINKSCASIKLDPANQYKPHVCANITLSNTSAAGGATGQYVIFGTSQYFIDDHNDNGVGSPGIGDVNLKSQIPLVPGSTTVRGLAPTDDPTTTVDETKVTVQECWDPAKPDGTHAGPIDPFTAHYGDTAYAKGQGVQSGVTAEVSASASCSLCPTCTAPTGQ